MDPTQQRRVKPPYLKYFVVLLTVGCIGYAAILVGIEVVTPRVATSGTIVGQFMERIHRSRRRDQLVPCPRIEYQAGGRTRTFYVHDCQRVLDGWRIGQRVRLAVHPHDPRNVTVDQHWFSRWATALYYLMGGLIAAGFWWLIRWSEKRR